MKKLQLATNLVVPVLISLASSMLHAQPAQSSTTAIYLQYGSAEHNTDSWTGGVMLPWNWSYALGSGRMTGYWDLSVSRWSADYQGGNRSTWVLGAQPTLRWRPSQGQSPWFLQAGLGASYAINHRFITDHKEFSTRYNFASHIGIGYLFGEQLKNEISLRLEHQSNAGIKRPNPGENFLQLRYARHF
ncbi:acyloxyacyl hydrolase [Comamonas testosteroni]|uniref:acyloxyacyl hydrolase n=1 Tax=Comamonas testosteroni TaxID=285 RepID=UPI0026E9DE8E|nr:acyloxyacyl hydrolase [Comamonas testosteroni]WQD43258.1 acyloxyacyl hydrolase [Comamonas testosteroni]